MFKILLTILCFISYGTAIRILSQEPSFTKISGPTKSPQCICTDGTTLKTVTPNDDKFGFLNTLFPKEPVNPFADFFDSFKAPETKGSLLENLLKPLESIFPPRDKPNDISSFIKNLIPGHKDETKNLMSLLQIPKVPGTKLNHDEEHPHIPDHICSSLWPNTANVVPKIQKTPISIHLKPPVTPSPQNVLKGALDRPNSFNSVQPTNQNINLNNGNSKQVKLGATLNPNTGIKFPDLNSILQGGYNIPQNFGNMFNGLANFNPFNGLSMPNYNLGAGLNLPNIGALAGALTNPNGGLKMSNGLNIKSSFLGAIPGLNSNLNLGSNPNLNLGFPGVNLGATLNPGLKFNGNPTVEAPDVNFLSSLPKDEPNSSATTRLNMGDGSTATSEGTSAPNAEISSSTAENTGEQSTNTQNASTNVSNNESTPENSMASPTAEPESTSSSSGIAPDNPFQGQPMYQSATS